MVIGMDIQQQCVTAYRRHKHLKLAAKDVGIPWQTVYVHLRRAGEPVTGDKARYGSDKDRLAAKIERHFKQLVPFAEDMNRKGFQAKYDFRVNGHLVDVKSARPVKSSKNTDKKRWAWSSKKQESGADFFVCFACDEDGEPVKCLLIPGEVARTYVSISLSCNGGKWGGYEVDESALAEFFMSMPPRNGKQESP